MGDSIIIESSSSSSGSSPGVGEVTSIDVLEYSPLWGSGDISISIMSPTLMGTGDEAGRGGVVMYSLPSMPPITLDVNSARRGVGNRGLASASILKFWDRSAAKLAVGEEPRADPMLK